MYNGSYFYFSFFVCGLRKKKRILRYPFHIFYHEIEKRKTKGRYIHGPQGHLLLKRINFNSSIDKYACFDSNFITLCTLGSKVYVMTWCQKDDKSLPFYIRNYRLVIVDWNVFSFWVWTYQIDTVSLIPSAAYKRQYMRPLLIHIDGLSSLSKAILGYCRLELRG